MLEIVILIFLCRANYKNAVARGKSGGLFIFLTLALWIVLEVIGINIGLSSSYRADLMTGMLYGLGFAAVGGVLSYVWAKAGPLLEDKQAEDNQDDTNNNIVI